MRSGRFRDEWIAVTVLSMVRTRRATKIDRIDVEQYPKQLSLDEFCGRPSCLVSVSADRLG